MFCVADGVPHGVAVAFDADDLPGLVGGCQADGADAAVGVQHGLCSGELSSLDGKAVEDSGLDGVHLIEAAGADGIGAAAERIQNKALAVQHLFVLAQHGAGSFAR